jgi:hypothetical protein
MRGFKINFQERIKQGGAVQKHGPFLLSPIM